MRDRWRGAAWMWAAITAVALGAAVLLASRGVPGTTAGPFDPVNAVIGLAGLSAGLYCAVMAVRADRRQAASVPESTARLARAVVNGERAARRQLLGDHDRPIDVAFAVTPGPAHPARGAERRGRLEQITDYYRRLTPRRLVITGEPGAGKTVLAVELILGLLAGRDPSDPVPVRLSAASLATDVDPGEAVEHWLRHHLREVYRLPRDVAAALVAERMVLPVVDGLDELDADPEPGYASRAALVIRAVNAYQDVREKGAVVLTCRTGQYEALQEQLVWAHDATRVQLAPVDGARARRFLTGRGAVPDRWEPVLAAIKWRPGGPLARGLATPWRLTLAATIYDQRDPRTGAFVRHPADLTDLPSEEAVRDHLLGLLIPAAVATTPPPGNPDVTQVSQWLATLAGYLDANTRSPRMLDGRALSGTDLILHELWPLAGERPRLITAAAAAFVWLAGGVAMVMELLHSPDLSGSIPALTVLGVTALAAAVYSVRRAWKATWPEPSQADVGNLRDAAARRRLALAVLLGVAVGLTATLFDDDPYALLLGLAAGLPTGLTIGLAAALTVSSASLMRDPRDGVRADMRYGLLFGGVIAIAMGAAFAIPFGPLFGLTFGVTFGLSFGLTSAFGALAGLRYLALLISSRRRLPGRLGRFLHWAYRAGLLRIAGIAYQFRHRELQDWLARRP